MKFWELILSWFKPKTTVMPEIAYSIFGLNKIVQFETGGKAYYNKYLQTPSWPGGDSGVTVAVGIDIGYLTKNRVAEIFSFLPASQVTELQSACGYKGTKAKAQLGPKMAQIHIAYEDAVRVFQKYSVPEYTKQLLSIYPTAPQLNPDTTAMLLSLVYNRGTSLKGVSRVDMADIAHITETIEAEDYEAIAKEFEEMERLWIGKGLDGLVERRQEEADIIRHSVNKVFQDSDVIRVKY